MILRTSAASPFGRKVRIAIDVLGLASQIRVIAADTNATIPRTPCASRIR